jgi:hypothetical protein
VRTQLDVERAGIRRDRVVWKWCQRCFDDGRFVRDGMEEWIWGSRIIEEPSSSFVEVWEWVGSGTSSLACRLILA